MVARALRLLAVLAITLFLTPSVLSAVQSSSDVSQPPSDPDFARLQMIAGATGHDAAQLKLLDERPLTLLNGRTLMRYKAIDVVTHEIVGATFDGDKPVDEQAAREEAGLQWQAEHGAITPQLAQRLTLMKPDDQLNVAVWLKANIVPLDRPIDPLTNDEAARETAGSINAPQPNGTPGEPTSKFPTRPIPIDQAPPEVQRAIAATDSSGQGRADRVQDKAPSTVVRPSAVPDKTAQLEQAELFKQQNDQALKDQLAPIRSRFLALMQQRGIKVDHASETVPSAVINGLTRAQIEEIARLPEIDAIYFIPEHAGPSLSIARPTQNANLINAVGYNGTGVKVSVTEGERAYALNPYLSITGFYSPTSLAQPHPTGVSGIIKSTAPGFNGLANGVTLYNANGSYTSTEWSIMSAAMDWGQTMATVLNNSWFWDSPNSSVFWEADRHQDYFVRYNFDFVAVAAGNFGNGCGSNFTSYVVSPAKGYNVMSVGNYEDNNTLGWSDDSMSVCSSFGDPAADTAGSIHAKPEVAAVGGATISSTAMSSITSTAIITIGSGTSFASPMVSALAADMIEADPNLGNKPEAIKSIIMATALHNIEGAAKYSDKDGAGGIDATAAIASVERKNYTDTLISNATSFPITITQFAYKGERVRFVINWLSNPAAGYTSDPLPADLDLTALRASGALITTSSSIDNSFEIVDFIAPATETYSFRISKFTYSGGSTYLGAGWWRGTYRIAPDAPYLDPKATPLGTHLSIYPTDWSPTNYWRALGIRPTASDHDLELYTRSWFDDPSQRTLLRISNALTGTVDFMTVDGNQWPAANQEQYVVSNYSGNGGYGLSWSNLGQNLFTSGLYGPYSMSNNEVVKVFDVYFRANKALHISVIPTISNTTDLAMYLFRSNPADASTWAQARGDQVASADASTVPTATEQLRYSYTSSSADYLGLVVISKQTATGQFYIRVEEQLFLPLILK